MNRSLSFLKNIDAFKERIIKEYDSFSKRLQQVINFITDNPYYIVSRIMTEIADKTNLPISTFSRFAKHMGFRSLACSMHIAQVLTVSLMMQEVKCENLN